MPLGRRAAFKGLSAAFLASPFVPMLEARGQVSTGPKRFVVLWQPNGTIVDEYVPRSGGERDFALGRILEPLASLRDEMILLTGHTTRSEKQGGTSNTHDHAAACALTGRPMVGDAWDGAGVSIDQVIADHLFEGAPAGARRSVQTCPARGGTGQYQSINFRGPGQPLPLENNPTRMFDELLAGGAPDDAAAAAARRRTGSALDAVRAQLRSLSRQVGSADRVLLERHECSLRELEREVSATRAMCSPPDVTTGVPSQTSGCDDSHPEHFCALYQRHAELFLRILPALLSCDRTRVATLAFGQAGQHFRWPFIHGRNSSNHGIGHRNSGDANRDREDDIAIQRYHAQMVSQFVQDLKDRELLDDTIVLWQNELGSHWEAHKRDDAGLVLFGGRNLGMELGRWLRIDGRTQNDVHVSIARRYGLDMNCFGSPDWCQGPITAL